MCTESRVATEGLEAPLQRGGTKRRSRRYADEFQRYLGRMPLTPNGIVTFHPHH
jgi:hypothetical protein